MLVNHCKITSGGIVSIGRIQTRKLVAAIGVTLLMYLVAGCGGKSAEEMIGAAKVDLERGQAASAIVQLKSVLQADANSIEARLLLSKALLKVGDASGAAAEAEKLRGRDQKMDAVVLPILAKAWLGSGQGKKVISELSRIELTDAAADAELKAQVAMALVAVGSYQEADGAIGRALKIDPKNVAARMLQARMSAAQPKKSLEILDQLLKENQKQPEALNLKAQMHWYGLNDFASAQAAFREAINVDERFLPAYSGLIRMLIQQRKLDEARSESAAMAKRFPSHPETILFDTQLNLLQNNIPRAKEGVQQLLRLVGDSPIALQLAGAVEMRSGNLRRAEGYLTKALTIVPALTGARQVLAEIYIQTGEASRAISILQPAVDATHPNPDILLRIAEAQVQLGNFAEAERLFNQVAKLSSDPQMAKTALAVMEIAKGRPDAGLSELEALARSSKNTYSDMALINARLVRKDWSAAHKAIDHLATKQQGDVLYATTLHARVHQLAGDFGASRTRLTEALAADPKYVPAALMLAAQDLAEKKPEQGLKRFDAIVKADPNNATVMLAIASIKQQMGAGKDELVTMLSGLAKAVPNDPNVRLALITQLLEASKKSEALAAARDASSAFPEDIRLGEILSRAQIASGDSQQGLLTLSTLSSANPKNTELMLRLADAQMSAGEAMKSRQTLRRVLELNPGDISARKRLVRLTMSDKDVSGSLAIAKSLQKDSATAALGILLEADIYSGLRNWPEAIGAYKRALEKSRTTELAVRVHATEVLAGHADAASAFAASWLREHPKDAEFISHLGMMALEAKNWPVAEARFREVTALRSNFPLGFNNLAWSLVQQKKSGGRAFAEKANALLPDQPWIMDTLSAACEVEGDAKAALEWQRKAVAQAPNAAVYRLTLARRLIAVGDNKAARTELEALAGMGAKFGDQATVTALLKTLP